LTAWCRRRAAARLRLQPAYLQDVTRLHEVARLQRHPFVVRHRRSALATTHQEDAIGTPQGPRRDNETGLLAPKLQQRARRGQRRLDFPQPQPRIAKLVAHAQPSGVLGLLDTNVEVAQASIETSNLRFQARDLRLLLRDLELQLELCRGPGEPQLGKLTFYL
jgi:hypothetical protein